jgi:hypothetical protein
MKLTKILLLSMVALLIYTGSAAADLPKTINLQSVVYDQDGNVTEADFVEVSVQIVDESGNVYFQEDHYDVPVAQGAMNLIIGEASGGIPAAALDPTAGRRFVDVLIDGANPYDILPLSSVPYSIWADTAVGVVAGSIGSDSIQDGAIELKHLATGFELGQMGGELADAQIPTNIVRQETFDLHLNNAAAHQAPAISMNPAGAFAAQLGATVQIALETLYSNYATEVANRQTAIANLNTQLTNSVNSLQSQITSNDGDISSINSTLNSHANSINSLSSSVASNSNSIANHEVRIAAMEGGDPEQLAHAWGVVSSACSNSYGYNVSGTSCTMGIKEIIINFSSSAPNSSVAIALTPLANGTGMENNYAVSDVSAGGFRIECYNGSGSQVSCTNGFHWMAFADR